jgi:hypothetical protein
LFLIVLVGSSEKKRYCVGLTISLWVYGGPSQELEKLVIANHFVGYNTG